jgi:hypothetical protein
MRKPNNNSYNKLFVNVFDIGKTSWKSLPLSINPIIGCAAREVETRRRPVQYFPGLVSRIVDIAFSFSAASHLNMIEGQTIYICTTNWVATRNVSRERIGLNGFLFLYRKRNDSLDTT